MVQAVAVHITILAGVALVSFFLVNNVLSANRRLERTYRVIATAEEIQNDYLQRHNNAQGYVLTGKPEYLAAFRATGQGVASAMPRWRALVADDPQQAARLERFHQAYQRWSQGLQAIVTRRQQATNLATVEFDDQELLEQMRREAEDIGQAEANLLSDQSARVVSATQRTLALGLGLLLLAAAAIGWATYRHLRALAQRYGEALNSTQRRTAELKSSQERLAGIIGSAMDAIISVNQEQRVILFNRAAEEMFGLPAPQAMGQPLDRFLPARYREQHRQHVANFGQTGATSRAMGQLGKLTALRADGEEFPIEAAISHVTSDGQSIYTVVLRDITARKRAEQEIQQAKDAAEAASRAKDQFMAMLSHELRTPLTPVLSLVASLEAGPDLTEDLRGDLALIRRNVELEARLIDDLLDLTRISKGKLRLRLDNVDVSILLEHTLQICRSDVIQKELKLDLDLAARRTHVRADPARLQQVFWNLFKNAIKFTPHGGTITIQTQDDPAGQLRICVQDSGIGIPADVLPRIFNAFEQGEPAVTRQFGGLGLGLAITRMLVTAHQGQIAADSPGRGKGATFTILLPTIETPVIAPDRAPADLPMPVRRDLQLLLVEDHADTLRVMTRLLTSMGYQVTTAGSIAEALTAAERQRFDVVISDIGLPDGTGLQLIGELHKLYPVPGIALSGYGMEADVARCRDAGFSEHVTKPVDMPTLDAMIQKVVASDRVAAPVAAVPGSAQA